MALSTMYAAMPGSPVTSLTSGIAANSTSMTLDDASVLPAAPNICVLGSDSSAEIVSYTSISGNVVSGLVRALGGTTASAWAANTAVARNITSLDHDTFMGNITDLDTRKADTANEIMYFSGQTVSVASNAQIMRIPASGTNSNITTNTVVLACSFAAAVNITSDISWQSYAGYVTFTGSCSAATTANVTLGIKGN